MKCAYPASDMKLPTAALIIGQEPLVKLARLFDLQDSYMHLRSVLVPGQHRTSMVEYSQRQG